MERKSTIRPRNNGNLNDLLNKKFSTRMHISDYSSYHDVIRYLEGISVKTILYGDTNEKSYYILDAKSKQIAKANRLKRIIELTGDVSQNTRDEIYEMLNIRNKTL